MCLAALALGAHPRFPLVIAANRDEVFGRPTAPMAWWTAGGVDLLAGRDLEAGGTWLGLTRAGRLALLTNVREPDRRLDGAPSRGELVVEWLAGRDEAPAFARRLRPGYNGFNLITADLARGAWHWISNRAPAPVALEPGLHGLSNAALDTPWPKTVGLKAALAQAIGGAADAQQLVAQLMDALADATPAPDAALPDTGVGLIRERLLSPRFVRMPDPGQPALARYGTRCSTVLVREAGGRTLVVERSVTAAGGWLVPVEHRLAAWP
ncbi:NRDE family protein [Roseateles sp.]|uniref:NRDE family protein n=1 Tax=Roseateles sp. TaxID=1971397 RepID=UPI0025DF2DCE|nr:NRDE family protein [Roseateles sp.]MBV8034277.1 NRDE family protein [Roseateles sp.]